MRVLYWLAVRCDALAVEYKVLASFGGSEESNGAAVPASGLRVFKRSGSGVSFGNRMSDWRIELFEISSMASLNGCDKLRRQSLPE